MKEQRFPLASLGPLADLPLESAEELRGKRLGRRRSASGPLHETPPQPPDPSSSRHDLSFILSGSSHAPEACPAGSPPLPSPSSGSHSSHVHLAHVLGPLAAAAGGQLQSPRSGADSHGGPGSSGTQSLQGSEDESSSRKRRREEHNDKEKRRRDKMNTRLCELKALVPALRASGGAPNKETILARTVEHLSLLTEAAERLKHEAEGAARRAQALREENEELRARLLAAQAGLNAATLAAAVKLLNPVGGAGEGGAGAAGGGQEGSREAAVSALQLLAQAQTPQQRPMLPPGEGASASPAILPPPPRARSSSGSPAGSGRGGLVPAPIRLPGPPSPPAPGPLSSEGARAAHAGVWGPPPSPAAPPTTSPARAPAEGVTWLSLPPPAGGAEAGPAFCSVVLISPAAPWGAARGPPRGGCAGADGGGGGGRVLVPLGSVAAVGDVFEAGAREPHLRPALLRCVGIRQGLIAEGCCRP
eukprot:tig00001254_g7817.t1